MSSKNVSAVLRVWHKWKALPLPWRKRVLAGVDLKGNTYWELRDQRAAELGRVRRIVKYPRSTHYSEVTVPPAWHQWLRHTRDEPPSVDEQRAEVLRQQRIKILAAEADARWKAKPSVLDGPEMGHAVPPLRSPRTQDATRPAAGALAEDARETVSGGSRPDEKRGGSGKEGEREKVVTGKSPVTDPWAQAAGTGAPGQNWQPQGWNPPAAAKR